MTKTRRVFGRRRVTVENQPMVFELRADGLHVRKLRARRWHHLSFHELRDAALGQGSLFRPALPS